MKAVFLSSQPDAGFVLDGEPDVGSLVPETLDGRFNSLSVKATLRLEFAVLLIATLAIGVFSLTLSRTSRNQTGNTMCCVATR
jgi:methyl-accepting chemotaxis protein